MDFLGQLHEKNKLDSLTELMGRETLVPTDHLSTLARAGLSDRADRKRDPGTQRDTYLP